MTRNIARQRRIAQILNKALDWNRLTSREIKYLFVEYPELLEEE